MMIKLAGNPVVTNKLSNEFCLGLVSDDLVLREKGLQRNSNLGNFSVIVDSCGGLKYYSQGFECTEEAIVKRFKYNLRSIAASYLTLKEVDEN